MAPCVQPGPFFFVRARGISAGMTTTRLKKLGHDGFASNDIEPRLYLKTFDARSYPAYWRRAYDPEALLEEIGEWRIAEMLQQGWSEDYIAKLCDVSLYAFRRWMRSDPRRETVFEEATRMAAGHYVGKAEDLITTARNDFELKKASKLAEHYRWMAERMDRPRFGQQVKVQNENVQPMQFHFDVHTNARKSTVIDGKSGKVLEEVETTAIPTTNIFDLLEEGDK